MKKQNWWEWIKKKNEKTYGSVCEHKDRMITPKTISCRSCGKKEKWNGSNYRFDGEM